MMRLSQACLSVALLLAASAGPARAQKAVYLVRHAEKAEDYEPDDHLDGDARWPLSKNGEAQAEALARRLVDAEITAIYVSRHEDGRPIWRTQDTAAPFLLKKVENKGTKIALHEIPYPEALNPKSLKQKDVVAALDALESYAAGVRDTIRKEHPDGVVLIVGHDNTLPAIIKAMGHPGEVFIGPREFDHLFALFPR